jgi:hypothetical protein
MNTANLMLNQKTIRSRGRGLPRRLAAFLLTAWLWSAAASLICLSAGFAQNNNRAPSVPSKDFVYVAGPGTRPELMFACCDQGAEALNNLLADTAVWADLKGLQAGLAVALDDLSPARAQLVQRMNAEGIPAVAWIVLPRGQGYYVNASNAPQTAARFADFEKWSNENNLHWQAVGLDIEPNFGEFHGAKLRAAWALLKRGFDGERVRRSREEYSALIRQMQQHGYRVQTYQLTFIADERKAHSTVLERLFGLVDVRGDEEVLMAYSSFNHKVGSAMVWSYGQDTQTLAVGSTLGSGNAELDAKFGPLNWEEFSHDTIVASHFSHLVGVYSLEGCVKQGFLPRLKAMDWNQGVALNAATIRGVHRFRVVVQVVLWAASHVLYFIALLLIGIALLVWRRRKRKQLSSEEAPGTARRRLKVGPSIALILLAPIVAEVLSGTTRASFIFVLIPEAMVWGCGTLMIRETVRRLQLGWQSFVLLGMALSVAEEFVIQQTSLAPIPWVNQAHLYGRAWGVNWVWLLAMLGFTVAWVVLVPIRLTELIFYERREECWLRRRGWIICSVLFLIGSRIAWYGWTQRARPAFHVAPYTPPLSAVLSGIGAIVLLVLSALRFRNVPKKVDSRFGAAINPWLAGLSAAVDSFVFLLLFPVAYGVWPGLPVWVTLVGGIAWVGVSLLVIRRWASSAGWNDVQWLTLCFGSVVTLMLAGYWGSSYWPRVDLIGKIVLNIVAAWLLIRLLQRVKAQELAAASV